MTGWLPMDEAPRDNRRVLLSVPDPLDDGVADDPAHVTGGLFNTFSNQWEADDWNYFCCGCHPHPIEPNGWQHLPEPLTEKPGGGES